MSLLNTWTKTNRVITANLSTTYERELKGSGFTMYWLYTRTRTKEYKYVGLTKSAAYDCANKLNQLYNRRTLEQIMTQSSPNAGGVLYFITGTGPTDRSQNATAVFTNQVTKRVVCGQAVPNYIAGCGWEVVVSVNEVLSYKYRESNYNVSTNPLPWSTFEGNPNARHDEFVGCITDEGENYDDADNGYGSPTSQSQSVA